jgi:hypothetical protein
MTWFVWWDGWMVASAARQIQTKNAPQKFPIAFAWFRYV